MALLLIRHASAGSRDMFGGDDLERPLDEYGRQQSRSIADQLRDRPISRLLSSPAVRCSQTLGPLAGCLGIGIEIHDALAEGTRIIATVELLRSMAVEPGEVALCSHGDVIPEAISTLIGDGTSIVGRRSFDKGSVWELEVRGRDIVTARQLAPPAAQPVSISALSRSASTTLTRR